MFLRLEMRICYVSGAFGEHDLLAAPASSLVPLGASDSSVQGPGF